MDDREKLFEIVKSASYRCLPSNTTDFHLDLFVTDLLSNGVTFEKDTNAGGKCSCYHEREIMIQTRGGYRFRKDRVSECFGTKEREHCSCGGDERKCDFYPEKREINRDAAPITNVDRIRAMSDFELRQFICGSNRCETCRWSAAHGCKLMEWLKQPAKEE